MPATLFAVLLGGVAFILYRIRQIGRRPPGFPPGPPTLPLIGNLHQMPSKQAHLQFQKWAEEYGPMYSLILGTKVMIVLSQDTVVKDLLDKRSNIYSSRPELYLGTLLSEGNRMVLMEYGDKWRMIRKTIHNMLNINASKSYVPYQDLENKQLLCELIDAPDRFIDHIRRYSNSLTTQILFGHRTISIDDPRFIQLFEGFHKFTQIVGSGSSALLDLYPILRKLPDFMLSMRRYAKELGQREKELYVSHWLEAKNGIKSGITVPCVCRDIVKAQEIEGFSDELAGYISGSLLEAGSDTTSSTLIGFVQAMIIFPDVQKKAREEIDRVCGDRLPTMDDEPQMQYIRGCIKETLRWMPTTPLGMVHAVIRDDEYMGYKIPKGARVMYNVWGIHMDPKRHPEPRVFDPTRYADDYQTALESASNADVSKRDHFSFGVGRRICQGMHISERSLFLGISRLIWGFEFEKARDAQGNEIIPDADQLTEGLVAMPQPFPAKITPRSEKHVRIMRGEWDKCQSMLDKEKQWKEAPLSMRS
ncbi:hypothetical protein AJ79_05268 [Helicocarpus griseus UAMH5409]|uniref:Cytochrome P450 n=1 Tax=Helicocarpus griseus UAMH5409 TaxID=1447875 RepID=A0A2B7XPC6_9EURO|nr:hypothetical protein AJ79_05268 [Helicocarpus griseus UAMH5409]